jgi:hypothetical protein
MRGRLVLRSIYKSAATSCGKLVEALALYIWERSGHRGMDFSYMQEIS